ncbi:MAG TPA: nitronate monooxygenase [Mycobacteriales bacterium]|nr:nitronate monooxygenase [Mycobacteriales bacterium]
MLSTWLTQRFGISVPVVSAPMAGVSGGALAGAVSAAGALGTIGFAAGTPEQLTAEIDKAAAPGKPWGIGFLAWLLPRVEELLDLALERGPALVSLSYGDYAPYVERIKKAGAVAVTQCGTLDDAKAAVDAGVDAIVVRGGEGGGHGRDEVATLPLLQAVLEDIEGVPVLAAGGIATARGVAAVLAAGAAGAWVGSAFLACDEGANDDSARDAVVAAGLTDTIYTTVLDIGRGIPWPAEFGGRAISNDYAATWHGREEELRANPVRSEDPTVWAGQVVGLVRSRRPAADVVADLGRAESLLAEVCASVTSG